MNTRLVVGIPEGAEMIGHGRSFLYELIKQGKVDARKSGRRTVLMVESLQRYVDGLPKVEA